ncbi:MAG: hypothetical protein QM214_06865 [Bacillota bacterium]|jgi:hypothetical protein|nr:hypothetical protein [Bacillota bacterium]HHU43437.1 hypothetical protein [Clostridiales bacterium]
MDIFTSFAHEETIKKIEFNGKEIAMVKSDEIISSVKNQNSNRQCIC